MCAVALWANTQSNNLPVQKLGEYFFFLLIDGYIKKKNFIIILKDTRNFQQKYTKSHLLQNDSEVL